jgi:hypothetical protein
MEKMETTKKEKVVKPNFEYLRDKDAQVVRGKFIFHEVPGGVLKFPFRKWKGDPIKTYTLKDGEIYEIPLGLAKHLNKECKYPVHSYAMEEDKSLKSIIGNWVRRCSFQSLEFVEIEDLTPVGRPQ